MLSAVVGIAIEQGFIESVDQPMLDFFPELEIANLSEDKQSITLEHLLTMTSGLECRGWENNSPSEGWLQFTLDLPMETPPGSNYHNCSTSTFLVSEIVRNTTGMITSDFARENLFEPLGIDDAIWLTTTSGITIGWGDMFMQPHDIAKIGLSIHEQRSLGRRADNTCCLGICFNPGLRFIPRSLMDLVITGLLTMMAILQ